MVRAICFVILFAFTLASGGVHKLAHSYDLATLEVSSTHDVVKAGVEHCCKSTGDEKEIEKPRCLGDNCIWTVTTLFQPDGYSSKIRPFAEPDLGNIDLIRFLRPPIV